MENRPESHILVIFGASGDLAWRKLMPAIYDLVITSYSIHYTKLYDEIDD